MKALLLFFFLICEPLFAAEEFPAKFISKGELVPTVQEYLARVNGLKSEVQTAQPKSENVVYGEKNFKGLILETEGFLSGTKVSQKLTYIMEHPGLWKLVYIEGKRCIMGQAIREGEWVDVWGCDDLLFPISGAYGDIFLADNEEIDLVKLSKLWGREIKLNVPEEEKPEVVPTLGDVKKAIISLGGSWALEETTWVQPGETEKQEALTVFVEGELNKSVRFKQSFTYIYEEENKLKLKEIDGEECEFVERAGKDICKELYFQTRKTPFPFLIVNSLELTEGFNIVEDSDVEEKEEEDASSALFKCGNLAESYGWALRVYFESSALAVNEISNFRKVFSKLPKVVDPAGILLTESEIERYELAVKEPFILDSTLSKPLENILMGARGNCDALTPFTKGLKDAAVAKKKEFESLIAKIKQTSFEEIQNSELSQGEQGLVDAILKAGDPAFKKDKSVFLDVALGSVLKYLQTAVDLASNEEKLVTAAMFKQDVYSGLLGDDQSANATSALDSRVSKKYFGITVKTGLENSYVLSIHPDVLKASDIRTGDMITSINGVIIAGKTTAEVDALLTGGVKELNLNLIRNEKKIETRLELKSLDLSKVFYSLEEIVNLKDEVFIKINISFFQAGLGDSLKESLISFGKGRNVRGYILNLESNPGGNADEAFKIASLFVKDKTLGYFSIGYRWSAEKEPILSDSEYFMDSSLPLIVMVNSKTQSAAEVLASSLDALNRSVTVGSKTYGKHVAQTLIPVNLSNGTQLKALVTSAEYFDSLGRSLNGKGLKPLLVTSENVSDSPRDGNSEGRDYVVPDELIQIQYKESLSEETLNNLQEKIDNGLSSEEVLNDLINKL